MPGWPVDSSWPPEIIPFLNSIEEAVEELSLHSSIEISSPLSSCELSSKQLEVGFFPRRSVSPLSGDVDISEDDPPVINLNRMYHAPPPPIPPHRLPIITPSLHLPGDPPSHPFPQRPALSPLIITSQRSSSGHSMSHSSGIHSGHRVKTEGRSTGHIELHVHDQSSLYPPPPKLFPVHPVSEVMTPSDRIGPEPHIGSFGSLGASPFPPMPLYAAHHPPYSRVHMGPEDCDGTAGDALFLPPPQMHPSPSFSTRGSSAPATPVTLESPADRSRRQRLALWQKVLLDRVNLARNNQSESAGNRRLAQTIGRTVSSLKMIRTNAVSRIKRQRRYSKPVDPADTVFTCLNDLCRLCRGHVATHSILDLIESYLHSEQPFRPRDLHLFESLSSAFIGMYSVSKGHG
eukprot:gnl/Dysnectes_brevis/5647_a8243_505.p1 GENE.gnl/Dysnectes_brevis/5647_a8243_505~~gnl/Dysnectes_brevis/5647_a8243_505.p1  ORF type:complete len:403 (-),score=71.53 gnl/Dysnectes_brevis/5647_a8243_505:102-1310(-)